MVEIEVQKRTFERVLLTMLAPVAMGQLHQRQTVPAPRRPGPRGLWSKGSELLWAV